MLNRIIKLSLSNRLAIIGLSCVLLVGGIFSLMRMDIDIFPDLNAPTVVVMTEAPGFSAEEVEKLVTFPIESGVNGSNGVRRVRSSSTNGFSVVWIEFDWSTDDYLARQIVGERLDAIGESLPEGVSKPVMGPQSSILGEMMIIALQSDSVPLMEIRKIADTQIRPRLLSIGGVAQVSVLGGEALEYQIRLDPLKMNQYGVSFTEVEEALNSINTNARGGIIYDYGNEYIVRSNINSTEPGKIGLAVIRSNEDGSEIVTLSDIAEVVRAGREPLTGVASVNTQPAILLTVTKQSHQGTISLTKKLDEELEKIAKTLPESITIKTDIFRQSNFIEASVSNLQESLFIGAIFVIIVLFIFLMNVRTTVISVIAIPLSVLVSFLILNFIGYSINTMVLGGIAIAIGCLVDDAIVDVENVYKRLKHNCTLPSENRKSTLQVVFDASAEVRQPIFNSTLIIIAAFLPLFFLSGIEGRMLKPLGVSFIIALAASTIVALTLTPVLCSFLLNSETKRDTTGKEPFISAWMRRIYVKYLNKSFSHKKLVIGGTSAAFVAALVVFFILGRGFLPKFNEGSFTINISTLPGVSLEESNRIGLEAERIMLEIPEVKSVARKTGRAELDEHSQGVNGSEFEVPYDTKSGRSRSEISEDLRTRLSKLPGVVIEVGQPISHRIDAMLSGTKAQIAVKIFGDDLTTLASLGKKVGNTMHNVKGMVDVNVEQLVERPEIIISPKREVLITRGIKISDFSNAVSLALSGKVISEVYDGNSTYDVRLILDPRYRSGIDELKNITIDSPRGSVMLQEVANIYSTGGPNEINREDVGRRLTVSANVEGRDLRSAVKDLEKSIENDIILPEGYFISYDGQFESEEEASRTLLWASLCALAIIFMLLYGEFKNVPEALTILVNMPLALIGGIALLALTGNEINIPAIIGFISLMGITTRNGMLLISRYNKLKSEGVGLMSRIITGSSDRLLPIVMTALTSALALIPIALGGNEPGNEIQAPMAIVILGGLLSSTILNIFVVPIVYFMINKRENAKN